MKRKSISKFVRFEVLKRDKFTCQYCGSKAPDIVLHIDHIHPVSKDGDNETINLITSCYECNLGKSDRKLSDDSVVKKQFNQLALLQKRREQIELMFEWKKSLSNLDDETVEMIKEFVEAKIKPFPVSENVKINFKGYLKKYGIQKVLDAIDVSAGMYIRHSNFNGVTEESAEIFLDKIGGILFNKNLSPVEQKLAYIKNNAKRNLGYFDPRKSSILLKEYVAGLRSCLKYSDDEIIKDLENELIPNLDKEYNWSGWSLLVETLSADIRDKAKNNNAEEPKKNKRVSKYRQMKDVTKSELAETLDYIQRDLESTVTALNYLLKPFPKHEEKEFIQHFYEKLIKFIEDTFKYAKRETEEIDSREFPIEAIAIAYSSDEKFYSFIEYDHHDEKIEGWLLDKLWQASMELMNNTFVGFYFSKDRYNKDDVVFLKDSSIKHIREVMNGKKIKMKNCTMDIDM